MFLKRNISLNRIPLWKIESLHSAPSHCDPIWHLRNVSLAWKLSLKRPGGFTLFFYSTLLIDLTIRGVFYCDAWQFKFANSFQVFVDLLCASPKLSTSFTIFCSRREDPLQFCSSIQASTFVIPVWHTTPLGYFEFPFLINNFLKKK